MEAFCVPTCFLPFLSREPWLCVVQSGVALSARYFWHIQPSVSAAL